MPPNTIHQHFNADPNRPARLCSTINRIFKQCGLDDLEQIEDKVRSLELGDVEVWDGFGKRLR